MKKIRFFYFLLTAIMAISCQNSGEMKTPAASDQLINNRSVFIGTYTRKEGHVNGKGEGIYRLAMNAETGRWSDLQLAYAMTNPSFVAISSDHRNLYAVSELAGENEAGSIAVFAVDEEQNLEFLHEVPSGGLAPCYVSLDGSDQFVFVSNYLGGVVSVYKRQPDGRLELTDQRKLEGNGPHPRQESSHPHSITITPDNRFVLVPDLGADKIWIFVLDKEHGQFKDHDQSYIEIQPGAGPRHLDFHPDDQSIYLINELDNTVNLINYNKDTGAFENIQSISTLPSDYRESSFTADIHVHPSGRFLYGSNRGHNSIAVFEIDQGSGRLSSIQYMPTQGDFPRNFSIDPSGKFLYAANQNSDNVALFMINQESGTLSGSGWEMEIKTPVCIKFAGS